MRRSGKGELGARPPPEAQVALLCYLCDTDEDSGALRLLPSFAGQQADLGLDRAAPGALRCGLMEAALRPRRRWHRRRRDPV